LAYLSQNVPYSGTTNNLASNALNYTGNDGGIDEAKLLDYNQAAPGDTNTDAYYQQAARDFVTNAYKTYNGLMGGQVLGNATSSPNTTVNNQPYIDLINSAIGRLPGQLAKSDIATKKTDSIVAAATAPVKRILDKRIKDVSADGPTPYGTPSGAPAKPPLYNQQNKLSGQASSLQPNIPYPQTLPNGHIVIGTTIPLHRTVGVFW
jgi:hypothetical protein